MRRLLKYLGDYRKESVLGPLFKLLEAALELIVPLVVAAVIDRGVAGGDRGWIVRMCLLLVGLGLIGLGCSVTAQYYAAKASAGFAKKLKHALFQHMQGFSFAAMDTLGASTMITRMTSDMNQVQTGLNLTLRLLLRSPFVVFGAMAMAFTIDAKLALIFVAAIPLLSIVVFGVMLLCIPLYRKVQGRLDRVLSATRENLTGARVIRAFGREAEEIAAFDARNGELTAMQKRVGRISALMNPVTYVIINLAIIALIRGGAEQVNAGALTQGQIVALYNYLSQILVELIKLANLIINITKSIACANRIEAVLELPSGEPTRGAGAPEGDTSHLVEFRDVSLRYAGGGEETLSHVSFAVRPGQTVGVIGGTGSGKSSLVNLIPRFYEATSGQVLFGGRDVTTVPVDELRARIGIVPQKAVLFKGTIRENLRWGKPDADDAELARAVEAAQATDVVAAKGGLDAQVEQGGRNLSGGQRQRLTIARALVRAPELLILDDSSSALDFATDARLRSALKRLSGNPAVFIVSQRTSSIRHADLILVLDDGALVGAGRHDELLESCEVYREIYDSQFKKEASA